MLLSHDQLLDLIERGVIENAHADLVNAASIDLTLGSELLIEDHPRWNNCVDLTQKQAPNMRPVSMDDSGYYLSPRQFVLAQTQQRFNLPNDISAEFKLKSSIARAGLNHLLAGWCDAGWHGSVLTLELHNVTERHNLMLKPGMKIGQIIFYRHDPVSDDASYAARGRYNGNAAVTASAGVDAVGELIQDLATL